MSEHGHTVTERSDVPHFLDRGARWAWRFIVIAAAVFVVVWLVARLRVVMIPVFISFVLAALLTPAVDQLDRKLPRLAATWATLLSVLGLLVVLGLLLAQPIADATSNLTEEFRLAIDDLRDWLSTGPLGLSETRVDDVFDSIGAAGERLLSGLTEQPASTARLVAEIVAGSFLALVLTFFFLKDGREIWRWCIGLLREVRRDTVDRAGRAAFESAQGWIKGVAITGLADGLLIGAGLLVLGVPAAVPLAVITVFAAFFPIIGATVAGGLAALVALASNGLTNALLVVAVVLVVQQIEGDVLLPLVMRRQVSLHPIVVLLALAAGGALAGLVGALVAVPITAAGTAAIAAVNRGDGGPEPPPNDSVSEPEAAGTDVAMEPDDVDTARGATTITDVIAEATDAGYTAEMTAAPGARIRCDRCGGVGAAAEFRRDWTRRLEGSSDPDDLLHASGLVCPRCDARGLLIARYGPLADRTDSDVITDLSPPATPATGPAD